MEKIDIYNLLIDIDNGYEPTKEQEQLLYSVESISWNRYDILPKSIGRMRSLKHLDLSGCSNLEDISMLSGLTNLIDLGLSRCISLEDISALSKIETLSILDLSRTYINTFGKESICKHLIEGLIRSLERAKESDAVRA